MNPVIQFADFSFSYQGRTPALNNIQLEIPAGSFTAVAGLSSTGKTTLCLAVSGLVPHYFGGAVSGSVTVNGMNTLQTEVGKLAEVVGTVLEDYESQLVTMTVEEEVAFGLENHGVGRDVIAGIVSETLCMVGLAGMEKREVSSLSGGQKQRLAIAAALAPQPAVLVLDEPTSALDPEGAEELYALLGRLNRENGLTLMIVEHDISRVLPYADRLVVLEAGRLAAAGKTTDVLSQLVTGNSAGLTPALWMLKHSLETAAAAKFQPWLTNQEAIDQIKADLQQRGAEKIA